MHFVKTLSGKLQVILLFVFIFYAFTSNAQSPVLRITNNFNQQNILYNTDTFAHTTWKPVVYTDSAYIKSNRSWLYRKFFEEHLLQVQHQNFNIFADIIVDEYIGAGKRGIPTYKQIAGKSKLHLMNTRGYEAGGNIGDKFYFETAIYENQGRFPGYIDSSIRTSGVVPYQNRYKNIGDGKGFDFSYSSARLMYIPNKHFLFDLGFNNNFIGDGYRSLLLSDYNTVYPYFRTAFTAGNFQYSVMWSQYVSTPERTIYALGYPRKWGQTYLLDWHATKHFNISVFNAVISPNETADHKKDVGISLASPVMFVHADKSPSGVQLNNISGLNLKYTVIPSVNVYAQFMLDESGDADWQKRYGWQAGVRIGNLLKVQDWNVLAEFNTVRPYSYASDNDATIYSHNNEPLAHPLGANFKEALGVTDYTYKNWWFRLEVLAAHYGIDSSSTLDYGHDIFKPTSLHSKEDNIKTNQGLLTKLYYGDLRVAYILNKKTNLRIEAGAVYRNEKNVEAAYKDMYGYIGVRMSFRKLIYDF
jgi:hypothetical protein